MGMTDGGAVWPNGGAVLGKAADEPPAAARPSADTAEGMILLVGLLGPVWDLRLTVLGVSVELLESEE